jgi:branched-chain amino acid transport system substrate-binding protein
MMVRLALFASLVLMAIARPAHAADDILIGAIYPLTGNGSQVGLDAKAALGTEAEIINGSHDIPALLGKGGGLPHLGGGKIRLIFADHQSDPQKARAEAERLITQEHVAAIIGSYQSSTAATISQVTERYEIPYMSADNSSPTLNRRGLKWFFRTSPHDEMFSQAMFDFMADIGAQTGHPVKSVAVIYEDTLFGTDSSNIQKKLAAAAGFTVVGDIRYRGNSPSLSTEVQRLAAANADVVLPSSYTSDAILMIKGMHDLGYAPGAIIAQSAGFVEQNFLTAVGNLADGIITRSSFALDAVKSRPAIAPVNALYHATAGKDLNDNTAREIVALQVLADAIDRAASVKPEDIRQALIATDIPGEQTVMPWKGIKFDQTGQNVLGTPVMLQFKDGAYHTVWPQSVAVVPLVWKVGQ